MPERWRGADDARQGIKEVVYNGEVVYNRVENVKSTDPGAPNGLLAKDRIDYVLGVGFTLFDKVSTTLQWRQRIILDFEPGLDREPRVRLVRQIRHVVVPAELHDHRQAKVGMESLMAPAKNFLDSFQTKTVPPRNGCATSEKRAEIDKSLVESGRQICRIFP